MKALYSNTCSCVLVDRVQSKWFEVGLGIRQGCHIAPNLFIQSMYKIKERTVHISGCGTMLMDKVFTDLDDDVALLAEVPEVPTLVLQVIQEEASPLGLKITGAKSKSSLTPDNHCIRQRSVYALKG